VDKSEIIKDLSKGLWKTPIGVFHGTGGHPDGMSPGPSVPAYPQAFFFAQKERMSLKLSISIFSAWPLKFSGTSSF